MITKLPESMIGQDEDIIKINIKNKMPLRNLAVASKKGKKLSTAARTMMEEIVDYYT